MPDDVQQALDDWCKKNQTKCHEKKRDLWVLKFAWKKSHKLAR
jgi:hypothetical protein